MAQVNADFLTDALLSSELVIDIATLRAIASHPIQPKQFGFIIFITIMAHYDQYKEKENI